MDIYANASLFQLKLMTWASAMFWGMVTKLQMTTSIFPLRTMVSFSIQLPPEVIVSHHCVCIESLSSWSLRRQYLNWVYIFERDFHKRFIFQQALMTKWAFSESEVKKITRFLDNVCFMLLWFLLNPDLCPKNVTAFTMHYSSGGSVLHPSHDQPLFFPRMGTLVQRGMIDLASKSLVEQLAKPFLLL